MLKYLLLLSLTMSALAADDTITGTNVVFISGNDFSTIIDEHTNSQGLVVKSDYYQITRNKQGKWGIDLVQSQKMNKPIQAYKSKKVGGIDTNILNNFINSIELLDIKSINTNTANTNTVKNVSISDTNVVKNPSVASK